MMKWTLIVRLTHWLVAAGVIVNMFNESGYAHRLIGYVCAGLVLLRLVNGFWFARVEASKLHLPGFKAIKSHVQSLLKREKHDYAGHNPLGQYAVYAMWALIFLLAFTGWLSRTDEYWGEDWPVDLHEALSYLLQGMVVLHLLAVTLLSKWLGKNLIGAMVRGK